MSHNQKPILDLFRAAGRLINENRDTIYYAGLTLFACAHHAQSTHPTRNLVFPLAAMREMIRAASWYLGKEDIRLVQDYSKPCNRRLYSHAAGAGIYSVLMTYALSAYALQTNAVVLAGMGILAPISQVYAQKAGGWNGVYDAYKVMWNWPKNKGGGGTSQSQKIKDGFIRFARSLGPRLAPMSRGEDQGYGSTLIIKRPTQTRVTTLSALERS